MDDLSHSVDSVAIAWRLGAAFFFVALNAFFVASEFALVKVRPIRLETLAAEGSRPAKVARHLVEHLSLYLSACQVGVTVSSLAIGWLGEPAVSHLIAAAAGWLGIDLVVGTPALSAFAVVLAFTVITAFHMILGEQVPKMWALEKVEVTSLAISRPLRLFASLCGPFIAFVNGSANFILESLGVPVRSEADSSHTADEISAILAASARAGHISESQREFAENILGIVEREVRHILVPRGEVVYLALDKPLEENLRIIRTTGHSRFPLCRHDLDDVVGLVHAKDVLARLIDGQEVDLEAVVRQVTYVPDTMPLSRLISLLQKLKSAAAVVVDEYGTTIGLAFLEDALEEIVGPIQDEFDEEPAELREVVSGVYLVNGGMSLPEAAERLGIAVDDDTSDTIGGHVVSLCGELPKVGTTLEIGPYVVTVLAVEHHRVTRLRFERRQQLDQAAAD